MAIERVSAEDEVMLWPDQVWPQDIGGLAILEGGPLLDAHGELDIASARAAIGGRLHLAPRFRQILYVPPRTQGAPLWMDAARFDLAEHVHALPLAAPAGEAMLLQALEHLRRRRLDRSKPLWEMWFLTGLEGERVGLFMRMHHAMADGMAGVATLVAFLDVDPDTVRSPAEPWAPARAPEPAELVADARRRSRELARRRLEAAVHPIRVAHRLAQAWPSVRELVMDRPAPETSLDRLVGPGRRFALVRANLDAVKTVAHLHAAKVNDVLLTAVAGGLRQLLSARREPVDSAVIPVYVPVTLRRPGDEVRGNRIAQMVVPLPIGVADPLRRLRLIATETARRKALPRPSLGVFPTHGVAGRVFLKLITRQHVNVATADLPGPPVPLYFAGARVIEAFPVLPLIGTVSLDVGALSYNGQLNITVVADEQAYPDLEVFAAGMRQELEAVAGAVSEARTPVLATA